MKNKSSKKDFKKLEKLYKQKIEWILLLKIILTGTTALALGWFAGSIITLKMECGG